MQFPMVPSPPQPDSVSRYAPVFGANRTLQRETPVIGTRYCQHLHAIVPENLAYRVTPFAPAPKAPLAARLLSRALRHGEKEDKDVKIDIRMVPDTQVLAEGLTHHQAGLVPLRTAQKDQGIKYRALTRRRSDLVPVEQVRLAALSGVCALGPAEA